MRGIMSWLRVGTGIVGCMLTQAGCSFLFPGMDTRMAAQAKNETTWDQQSNLRIWEDTTHNRKVLAAEGEDLQIEFGENGDAKSIGGGTHILWQWSEPRDVTQAYMQLAVQNAIVADRMMGTLENLTATLLPMLTNRRGTSPPSTQPTP